MLQKLGDIHFRFEDGAIFHEDRNFICGMTKLIQFQVHKIRQHRVLLPGVRAMSLLTNHHFPRHSHDEFGIGVILAGAQHSWSAMGQVEASSGNVIMVNPGEMHDGMPLQNRSRYWKMIYINPSLVAKELGQENINHLVMVRPVVKDSKLANVFIRLFMCLTSNNEDALAVDEVLLPMLIRIFRKHHTDCSYTDPSPAVTKALQRINDAPELKVSLSELASLSGVSRFQLLRGFSRDVGITPYAYLLQRRVLLVQRLLAAGKSPAESATLAGFADQAHMTRAFVRQLGITPARFRTACI